MKKYIKAKELLENKAKNKEKKPIYATRKLSIGLVSCMLGLVIAAPVVRAEDSLEENLPETEQTENQEPVADQKQTPDTEEENYNNPQNGLINDDIQTELGDELGISPETVPEPVQRADIPAPTINDVFNGAKSISGGNLHREKVGGKVERATVYVTLKDKNGNVKAEVTVTPKSGSTWSVALPVGVEVAEGDTVIAYQELNKNKSPEATADAQSSDSDKYKDQLKMPTGTIMIEDTSASLVNEDEQKDARALFEAANPSILDKISSVEFKFQNQGKAWYIITYTDNSTYDYYVTAKKSETGELLEGVEIKQVAETSRATEVEDIIVTDNTIKGKLKGEGPFDGIKVEIVIKVGDGDKEGYCGVDGKCTTTKNSSAPIVVKVNSDGTFSHKLTGSDNLEIGQLVGISVKEPHKFKSCSTKTVQSPSIRKTEVRDPRELTDDDKIAIDGAIRKAYTNEKGQSKLPDGTGFYNGTPALIDFDKDGNARIINPSNVKGSWTGGKFVPEQNEDGSYIIKDTSKVITIPVKDLVKNLPPEKPNIEEKEGQVVITPDKVDTDASKVTVTFTPAGEETEKTFVVTKEGGSWKVPEGSGLSVDSNGVVSLETKSLKPDSFVKASVTDIGGLNEGEDQLTSEMSQIKIGKVTVSYDANGGTGTMDGKDLIKGSTYKLLANSFTAPENKEFDTWEIDGKKVAPDTEITVDKDTEVKAIWKDIKVKVTYDANGGSGTMDGAELNKGSTYKLLSNSFTAPENKEFDTWEIDGKKVAPDTEITVDKDTEVKAIWKSLKVKVKYYANGGTGTMEEKELDKGSKYNLLANGFTAPENKEFASWMIGDKEYSPEEEITVNEDTEVKAIWKSLKVKVKYDANGGTGTMEEKELDKGSKYNLLANDFTAPENKEFAGWKIGETEYAPEAEITVNEDTTVKAIWKDIKVKVTYDANGGGGEMKGAELKKGSKYKLSSNRFTAPKNQEFKAWEVNGEEVAEGTEITVDKDTVVKAIWKDKQTDNPPVEEKVKVIYDANGGSGTMDGAELKKGSKYNLLSNSFTAPENKEFAGWKIGENEYQPDAEITVNEDTTVKAIWKDKQTDNPPVEEKVKVTFNGNEGTGKMDEQVLKKGSEYKLPENGFTAPEGKEFSHWIIGNEKKEPGDVITVNEDTEVEAIWKDKSGTTPDPTPTPNPNPNPNPKPGQDPTPNPGDNPGGGQPNPNPDPNPGDNPGTNSGGDQPGTNPGQDPNPNPGTPGKPDDNTPGKPGDNTPGKPGTEEPGKPGNETPGTPGKEDPGEKPSGDKEKPNKPGEKDPAKPGVKVPGKDGKTNPDKPGIKIPGKDKPSESDKKDKKDSDASGTKTKNNPTNQGSIGTKKAGKNVKTGIGSGVGIVCTLVASTGALYISRKKED